MILYNFPGIARKSAGATPPGVAHVSPESCIEGISGEFEGGLVTPTCADSSRPRGPHCD